MSGSDTICAIGTPPGEGGIGIIRLSGDKAIEIASRVFRTTTNRTVADFSTHTIHVGELRIPETDQRLDEVLVAIMRAPHSYTREDVVEFHCHGSPLVLRLGLEVLIRNGARLADPGEFTRRAFLNGRLDLAQAEAVMDLIQARSEEGLRVAVEQLRGRLSNVLEQIREALLRLVVEVEAGIDFTEEGIIFLSPETVREDIHNVQKQLARLIDSMHDGRILREGICVVLLGRPNVGKSSLLNAIVRTDRSIVTNVPGTTRDVVEEFVNIRGIPVRLMDTAGIRESLDTVEREGVRRSHGALERADAVLLVLDASAPMEREDALLWEMARGKPIILVLNKSDLPPRLNEHEVAHFGAKSVKTSAITGGGVEELQDAIRDVVRHKGFDPVEGVVITHVRHQTALLTAKDALDHVLDSITRQMPAECIALDLRLAVNAIGDVIGETSADDVLDRIFSQFCIGK
jgi:tRNA modification GTPase